MIESLLLGTSLGLAAGLSPGPLMALAMTTTLQRGIRAGIIVAASPLLSDGPLIAIVLLAARTLSHSAILVLYLLGGVYVIFLGAKLARVTYLDTPAIDRAGAGGPDPAGPRASLFRGAVVNLLSPAPWLFWITVGAPTLVTTWQARPANAISFLSLFVVALVGSGIAIVLATAALGRAAGHTGRRRLGLTTSLLLLAAGIALLVSGVREATSLG